MSSYYSQYERQFAFDRDRITYAVQRLIVATTLAFIAQLLLHVPLGAVGGLPGGLPVDWLAFNPHLEGPYRLAWLWQPVTYLFLHAGLSHGFFNLLFLFFFGPDVERVLGTRQFFRFYILCGILAVLPNFLTGHSVVGASGAVMAVLVAYAVINPERELMLFPFAVPLNVRALVLILIVLNLVTAMTGGSGTSWATHLGGIAAGYGYMKIVPKLRDYRISRFRRPPARGRSAHKTGEEFDALGRAVDNIFNFEDKKRRRP
jgi:membrane associated rhomboid family serine protease